MKIIKQIRLEDRSGNNYLSKSDLFAEIEEAKSQVDLTDYEINIDNISYPSVSNYITHKKGGVHGDTFQEAYQKKLIDIKELFEIKIKASSIGFSERMMNIIKNQAPAFEGFNSDEIIKFKEKNPELSYDEIGAILYPKEGTIVNKMEITLKNNITGFDEYFKNPIIELENDLRNLIRDTFNEFQKENMNKVFNKIKGLSILRESIDSGKKKKHEVFNDSSTDLILNVAQIFKEHNKIIDTFYHYTPGLNQEQQKNILLSYLNTTENADDDMATSVKFFCVYKKISTDDMYDLKAKDADKILHKVIESGIVATRNFLSNAKHLNEFLDTHLNDYSNPFLNFSGDDFFALLNDFPEINNPKTFNLLNSAFGYSGKSDLAKGIINNLEKLNGYEKNENLLQVLSVARKYDLEHEFFQKINSLNFSNFYEQDLSSKLISYNYSGTETNTKSFQVAVQYGYNPTKFNDIIALSVEKKEPKIITQLKKDGIVNISSNSFYNSILMNDLNSKFSKYIPKLTENILNFKNEDNSYLWWNIQDSATLEALKKFNNENPGILKVNSKKNILNHLAPELGKNTKIGQKKRIIFEIARDVAARTSTKISVNNTCDDDGKNIFHYLLQNYHLTRDSSPSEVIAEIINPETFCGNENFKDMFNTKDKNGFYPIDYLFKIEDNKADFEESIKPSKKGFITNSFGNSINTIFKACENNSVGAAFVEALFNAPNSQGTDSGEKLYSAMEKVRPDTPSTKLLQRFWLQELDRRDVIKNHEIVSNILSNPSPDYKDGENESKTTSFKI